MKSTATGKPFLTAFVIHLIFSELRAILKTKKGVVKMPKPIPVTLRFDDAPDMINIQQLADMLGVCHRESSKLFNSKGFPVVSRMNGRKIAYKYDVAKFLGIGYGVNDTTPNEEILKVLNEILDELKKKNEFVYYFPFPSPCQVANFSPKLSS